MDKLIYDLMQEGKDVNDIMNMPFQFLVDIMAERSKPKKEKSLIAAFGGNG